MRLCAIIVLLSLLPFLSGKNPSKSDLPGFDDNGRDKPNRAHLNSHLNKPALTDPERSQSKIFGRNGRKATIGSVLFPALLFLKIKTAVLLLASLIVKTFFAGLLLSKTVTIVVREDRYHPHRLWYPTEGPYAWRKS